MKSHTLHLGLGLRAAVHRAEAAAPAAYLQPLLTIPGAAAGTLLKETRR